LDGNGYPQKIITPGQENLVDASGVIAATGVAQVLLAANANRSGFILQNDGSHNMEINDLGVATTTPTANNGSFVVVPGAYFPPAGYPVSTGAISIIGNTNDAYTVRAW
jgi:hypothetical protein